MAEFDIGELLRVQSRDLLTPQHAGLQHIGFVDRADLASSRPRELKRRSRHAADLAGRILLGVEAAALTIGKCFDAARLAKIDAAGEFANDDEIDALQYAGLQWRGF